MSDLTALLTLDGTRFSEDALRLVPFLRDMGVARLRLVGVWETLEDTTKPSERVERGRAVIASYLEERTKRLFAGHEGQMHIETSVRAGRAADQIIAEEVDSRADLIVIATHGRAGAERWRLGSVADEVVRRAGVPVLLAGPNLSVNLTNYQNRRIMVPLDGLAQSEQALPAAQHIAERTGASIALVRVVTLAASWALSFQNDPEEILGGLEAAAEADLGRLAAQLGCQSEVLRAGFSANVTNELIRYAANKTIDLIVMTSHSRPSLERWLLGSVADEMLRGPAPVLLVKAGEEHTSRLLRATAAVGAPEAGAAV